MNIFIQQQARIQLLQELYTELEHREHRLTHHAEDGHYKRAWELSEADAAQLAAINDIQQKILKMLK